MTAWTIDELNKIGNAEELEIASLRMDGSLRKRVIIWVVRIGDEIYIRSYKGRGAWWFRGVLDRHAGRIWAGGVEKDVVFVEEFDEEICDQISAAYGEKYNALYPQYVPPVQTPESRAATLRLLPQ